MLFPGETGKFDEFDLGIDCHQKCFCPCFFYTVIHLQFYLIHPQISGLQIQIKAGNGQICEIQITVALFSFCKYNFKTSFKNPAQSFECYFHPHSPYKIYYF